MNISLIEWLWLDRAAWEASESMKKLRGKLEEIRLSHIRDEEVMKFVDVIDDRLSDASFVAASLQLQTEWRGGDSSDPRNFGLREPNALTIVGHVPHYIEGSKGVDRLRDNENPKVKQYRKYAIFKDGEIVGIEEGFTIDSVMSEFCNRNGIGNIPRYSIGYKSKGVRYYHFKSDKDEYVIRKATDDESRSNG